MVMELHLKKLLDQMKNAIRLKHYAYCTEKICGSIGFCMQMFIANILGLCDGAESSENSVSPAKPA